MTNNNEIIFDPDCGISEDEQREIVTQINGIAEKNRQSLASAADDSAESSGENSLADESGRHRFKAKKSGRFFPVMVNAAAIAALLGGFALLFTFQGKTDAQVREGTKVYNSAERALIEEIRRETSSRLEAKETEISSIISKLADIDIELQELYSNNHELDIEQQGAEDRLKSLQDEYRITLALLQNERSRILEESRLREASLQAQLESRTRELAIVAEQSAAAIDFARSEMEKLSREQSQAAAVEAQMAALFANLNNRIEENQLDEAADTIVLMRSFLNTPAFQALRSIQARKDLYTQTINSFETMIEEARRNQLAHGGVVPEPIIVEVDNSEMEQLLADLQRRNAGLEQEITEKNRTLDAFTSTGTGMAQRVSELEGSLSALRTMNDALEAGSAEKNNQIRTLETANAALNQTVSSRNTVITRIEDILQGKSAREMTLDELGENITRIQSALQSVNN